MNSLYEFDCRSDPICNEPLKYNMTLFWLFSDLPPPPLILGVFINDIRWWFTFVNSKGTYSIKWISEIFFKSFTFNKKNARKSFLWFYWVKKIRRTNLHFQSNLILSTPAEVLQFVSSFPNRNNMHFKILTFFFLS